MNRIFVLFFILLLASLVHSQFLDNLQDPPQLEWKTIETEHFEVIFPAELMADAQKAANLCEYLYGPEIKTMYYPFKKMPLILSNQSIISNAYVTLAPRRSEWYATPFQHGSEDGGWYELLAVHEMRHMAQFAKLSHRGLNYFWRAIGGESAMSTVAVLLTPRWFWEGDAVLIETLLSEGGRGRKPDFEMAIRTQQLNNNRYSYYKSMLGSYNDYNFSQYALGYLMVSHTRKHTYDTVWQDIIGRSTFFTFFPFGFSASMRGITGENAPTTYNSTMNEFRNLWQQQQDSLQITPCEYIFEDKEKSYTNYLYPQAAADGTIYAMKHGIADPPQIVSVSPLGEIKTLKSISPVWKISVNNAQISWEEYSAHWRWGKKNFSDIRLFDAEANSVEKITSHGKYFSPAVSADGSKIAAVEYTTERKSSIVILDRKSGQELQRITTAENLNLKTPSWSEDDSKLVFSGQNGSGKSIFIFNFESGEMQAVLKDTWLGIQQPVLWKNYLLFSSGLSGIDNIYAWDLVSGTPYQVTSRPYGAFNPSPIKGSAEMLFNDYTANGYKIARMKLIPAVWQAVENIPDVRLNYFHSMIPEEQGGNILNPESIPQKQYMVEDYNSFSHMFNFHSWQIYPDSINLGAYFYSTDVLNTIGLGVGAFFNTKESTFGYAFNASYGGWYPIIDFSLQRLNRAQNYKTYYDETETDYWVENTAAIGLRLPIDLSSGNYGHALSLGAGFSHTQVQDKANLLKYNYLANDGQYNGNLNAIYYSLYYAHIKRYAQKDVRRQWAQTLEASFQHTPLESDYKGKHLYSRLKLYFPGILKHNSLLTTFQYEWQDVENYRFQPLITYPRGYGYDFQNAIFSASADYELPLLYPNFSISAWFYLKRIKLNGFIDYAKELQSSYRGEFSSAGAELLFDHVWFSFPIEFEAGYRFSVLLNREKYVHQIIFRLPLD